ncbi:ATP-binding protein [Saccharomonospora sp. NPDC006951]
MAGEAVRLLRDFGRSYAIVVRLVTLPPICAIALFRAAPDNIRLVALAVAIAAVWTCVQAWWLRRSDGLSPLVADVVILLGLSLTTFWTGAGEDTNFGWLRLLATFACVTWQWHTSVLAGGSAAVLVAGGMLPVFAGAGADPSVLRALVWLVVVSALSRAAWVIVGRAATRADRVAAEAERARGEAAVAAAVRADEREHANALHDTAATTLLMVGTGRIAAEAPWLAPQARRDLGRLAGRGLTTAAEADLVTLLRGDLGTGQVTVEFDLPERLRLPAVVATAFAGAASEAVTNVRRHAGADTAAVRLSGDARTVCLEITDTGAGFDVGAVPGTRRGLRESVRGRMAGVGGTATITSSPGAGTVVRLEWACGDD